MIIFKSSQTLSTLAQFLPSNPIIVEAGAFGGSDTLAISRQWPTATIHAFEPVPEIYDHLCANTQHNTHIHRYPYALSNHNGTATLYISEKPTKPGIASQAGSLHKPKERLNLSPMIFPRTTTVQTVTLPTWAAQNNVHQIDLLWLDTQGHELTILKATEAFLPHVKVILTEVAFIESYENIPLYQDMVTWLDNQGFAHIGRDFQDTSQSFFGNALFVRNI